jgi:hypothetical protein
MTDENAFNMGLFGIIVIKEALVGSAPLQIKPLYESEVGTALYDPQASDTYYSLTSLPGHLTLFFPLGLKHDEVNVVSMQWKGVKMLYQADRKFSDILSGGLKSLELTEIFAKDVEIYPPMPKPAF